jgi:lipocalin
MKNCTTCKVEKPLDAFYKNKTKKDGVASQCKVCCKVSQKEYRLKNKEKIAVQDKEYRLKNQEKLSVYGKEYRLKNQEKISVYDKEYNLKNQEKIAAYRKEYRLKNKEKIAVQDKERSSRPEVRKRRNERFRDRYNNEILYRLMQLLRSAVYRTFKGYSKPDTTMKLLYCTLEQFKSHIEKQFDVGMNWENQGEWHLDHIKPMNAFDLLDENEKRYCNHWSNFQPLWGPENISKQDSWTKEDESNYTPPDLDKAFELWDSEEI